MAPALVIGALAGPAGASSSDPLIVSSLLPGSMAGCDPVASAVSPSVSQVLSLVLPRATTSSPSGTAVAAESVFVQAEVTNLNPLVVDYQLRRGAAWSDGTRVGLADFIATAGRGAAGNTASAPQYRLIRSIRQGSSRHHVVVTFRTPTSAWPSLFSPLMAASTSPSTLTGCTSPSAAADISAGPFVIATSSADHVVLVRNPLWKGRTPAMQWIDARTSGGGQVIVASTSGPVVIERTWMTGRTLAALSSSAALSSQVDLSDQLLSLNFATTSGVTSSVMVRQALAHFIDRQAIVASGPQALDPKVAVAGSNLVSQGQPGYTGPPARPLSTSPTSTSTPTTLQGAKPIGSALASQFLHRAGWTLQDGRWADRRGRSLSIRLLANGDDRWAVTAARAIVEQLTLSHVPTTLHLAPSAPAVAQGIRSGRADAGVFARPADPYLAHAAAWFAVPASGPPSTLWTGYRDRTVAGLATKAGAMLNPVNALPLYQQVGRRLWVMMPTLPLYTEPFVTAWSSHLDGVVDNPYVPGTLSAATTWTLSGATKAASGQSR